MTLEMNDNDVLQLIAEEDLPKLRDLYKAQLPRAAYVYNYLNVVIKWKSQRPDKNHVIFMVPYGDWKEGTFVAIHEFPCRELFMFTLQEDCKSLCDALINTNKIDWNSSLLLYAVYEDHYAAVRKALENTPFRYHDSNTCGAWWIPKEKALKFEIDCPPEVYVDKLNLSHAAIINSHWPHRYEDSDKYVATIIEMNGGCGVFLKSDGTLVAWVLRNIIGLGILQTADGYKRRGYGTLVAKAMAKSVAEEGFDPVGTVLVQNKASQAMFSKLGFEVLDHVVFVENKEMRDYLQNKS